MKSTSESIFFNENQILFLRSLTDSWQSFYEISQKTGFSTETIEILIEDFTELEINLLNEYNKKFDFILVNGFKVKIGPDGKVYLGILNRRIINNSIKTFKNYKKDMDFKTEITMSDGSDDIRNFIKTWDKNFPW